jgi:hypothetical protein
MKTNQTAIEPEFGIETGFELRPAYVPDATDEGVFKRFKEKLLAIRVQQVGTKWEAPMRDAANEAAALAWTTMVPSLVFPELFEEKVTAAISQEKRQERILKRSRDLLAA